MTPLESIKAALKAGHALDPRQLALVEGLKVSAEARRRILDANAANASRAAGVSARARSSKVRYANRIRTAEFSVEVGRPADPRRRARCSKSLAKFLRTYFPEEFRHEFDENMAEVIRLAEQTIVEGGRFVVIMPRGSGKTTTLVRAALWAALTGRRQFVVILAATEPAAARLLQMLMVDLSANEILRADFPEVCQVFRAGEGKALRLKALHVDGERVHCASTRDRVVFPMVDLPGSAATGQVVCCRGLTGALRGITHTKPTGETIRPSAVLVDDPQTDASAKSAQQTADRESLLAGAVLGLAGPKANVAAMIAATVITPNDLAERLLDQKQHPEYEGRRFALVEKWAADENLWTEYDALWQGQSPKAAAKFYKEHRREMDAGAAVPCSWRRRPGELSALQTARNLRLEMGEAAFQSEMQGQPVEVSGATYTLKVEQILAAAVDVPRLYFPPAATVTGGHVDINRTGLHFAIVGADQKFSAHVAAYGRWPARGELWPAAAPEHQIQTSIFAGLKTLCDELAATVFMQSDKPARLGVLLVDAGFQSELVHKFADTYARAYPFRVIPSIGRAATRYGWNSRTIVGRPLENCHLQRRQDGRSIYAMHNADAFRETAQRAFLGTPGAPGSCTLHRVDNPRAHLNFAEHVVAEKLHQKFQDPDGETIWTWRPTPGQPNDLGDALVGARVACALQGLTTSGIAAPATRQKPQKTRISWAKIH